jgi:cold shock CspA family protein
LIGIEFDTLQEGDEVEFQPSKGPKGLRAENVQYGV